MEQTWGVVHLHTHTMYSLLDGALKPDDYLKAVQDWGMGAAAITDHGNMFGAVEFYVKAKDKGIKPIIGSEIYVAVKDMKLKEAARGNMDGANHLVLLAADNQGYRNLMKIVSAGYLDGFYYHPRVDKNFLKMYSEGLIALSACVKGEIPQLILQGNADEAERAAQEYCGIFGDGNFFLEIQRHGIKEEDNANEGLVALSRKTGIPLVATNDSHYLRREHADSHEVLLCISTGKTLDDPNHMKMVTDQIYLKSPNEMKELFADIPEALDNTVRIAERCAVEIKTGVYHPVSFSVPVDFEGNTDEYLARIAERGLAERFGGKAEKYRERLEYELGIIKKMGFSDYFLAIYDCTRAAREMGIPIGPARGSAGGSLVAYAVGITNLNPMKYGLIFERFLNPERVSLPDFDVDYADRDRGRMIEYVKHKYGDDHVCQIITFGTMKAKLVVRDVGRVLGMPYGDVDVIAKLIPNDLGMALDNAMSLVPELRELENKDDLHRHLFRHARVLEGLSRHAGTHAAGVIITPGPCTEYLPLYKQGNDITSQYEMEYVEKIGCLKVDFLGLRTLTVISDTVKSINAGGGNMDIDAIQMDDPTVYDLTSRGETVGIFQFESSGMRDYLRKLKPSCIDDLIAMNALYRPGPLASNMVDDFIERKHGKKKIEYYHPSLEDILKETYGVIVYQEQVMKIANVMAGFSLGAADELRRAMGKKKTDVMALKRHEFIEGAKRNGVSEDVAGKVFDLMAHFGGYGFNKSHSAGYAVLAYQTAWLKVHYPAQFMAASLTSEMADTERIVVLIEECRRMGIEVLPPDVNRSKAEFTVEDGNVRFGLGGIKNVGFGAIEAIAATRTEGGMFRNIYDFCTRVDLKALNKRMMESLIMAGAMDSLAQDRAWLLTGVDQAIEHSEAKRRERQMGQFNLFGTGSEEVDFQEAPPLSYVEPWKLMERLAKEKSVLGFWFSGHPLEHYIDDLRAFAIPFNQLVTKKNNEPVTVGGIVTSVTRRTARKDDKPYILLKIEDREDSGEVLLINGAYDTYKDKVGVDSMVLVEGTVSNRNGSDQPSVFANVIEPLESAREKRAKAVHITISTLGLEKVHIEPLIDVCGRHPGGKALWITIKSASSGYFSGKSKRYRVSADQAFIRDLRNLLGQEDVWIT